jgi:hypothetical protein
LNILLNIYVIYIEIEHNNNYTKNGFELK